MALTSIHSIVLKVRNAKIRYFVFNESCFSLVIIVASVSSLVAVIGGSSPGWLCVRGLYQSVATGA